MARWRCQDCPAQYGAWLSRCPRCGSAKELEMALSVCVECATKYAVGLPKCPHCGSTDHVEDGQPMPKITEHGGPSSVTAGPDEPGYMPPAELPETEPVAEAPVVEGGEEPSPGTSSSTSTETQPPKSGPSSKPRRRPVRKTESLSEAGLTESSFAPSMAGQKTEVTSASDDES